MSILKCLPFGKKGKKDLDLPVNKPIFVNIEVPSTDDLAEDIELALDDDILNDDFSVALRFYYCGGTLCADTLGWLVMMNLDGEISFNEMEGNHVVKTKMPERLFETVKRCYLETKGETEYYKREVK